MLTTHELERAIADDERSEGALNRRAARRLPISKAWLGRG
jgi:hypothetical protein